MADNPTGYVDDKEKPCDFATWFALLTSVEAQVQYKEVADGERLPLGKV